VNKRQISDRCNVLLALDPGADFTRLLRDDLERLLSVLEEKARGSPKVNASVPILQRLQKEGPLRSMIKDRPLLKKILER